MKTEEIFSGIMILGLLSWVVLGVPAINPATGRTPPQSKANGTELEDPAGCRLRRGPTDGVIPHVETHPDTSSLDQAVSPGIYDAAVPTSDVFGREDFE